MRASMPPFSLYVIYITDVLAENRRKTG